MLDTRRHDDIFDCRKFDLPVHIIGVGGVGSHVARLLAKLGVGRTSAVTVYDGDVVESHNTANQTYVPGHIGLAKVDALYEQYRRDSDGVEIYPVSKFVTERIPLSGVVFLCLDNMDIRKRICEQSVWGNRDIKLLVETRMSVAHAMVFALDPNRQRHVDHWNAYWYPSQTADHDRGCNGPLSIVTSVDVTAIFAAQSLIDYAKAGNAVSIVNRFCFELATRKVLYAETWG